jgi:hypothetical protein
MTKGFRLMEPKDSAAAHQRAAAEGAVEIEGTLEPVFTEFVPQHDPTVALLGFELEQLPEPPQKRARIQGRVPTAIKPFLS